MKNINQIIKEYKEYSAMEKEIEKQLEALKKQAIDYLNENEIDEYMNEDNGDKITYREVISKRFQSTEFRKIHADLYSACTRPTSTMRFTCS